MTPVLGLREAPAHPHLAARGTFVERDGVRSRRRRRGSPARPAPSAARRARPGADTRAVLADWGFSADEVGRAAGGRRGRRGDAEDDR